MKRPPLIQALKNFLPLALTPQPPQPPLFALKGKAAGEYVIKEFETQANVPNSPGVIPSGSTLSFAIWMRDTASAGTMSALAKVRLNSSTGATLCTATGAGALTSTVLKQNV
jgi:hypothetical protein